MIYRVRGLVRIDLRAREGRMFDDCEVSATVEAADDFPLSLNQAARVVLYNVMNLTQLPCWWLRDVEVEQYE